MKLVLFDIDGTLIQINGVGRKVMRTALEVVFGSAGSIDNYSFAGKTDLAIIYDLLTELEFTEEMISDRLPHLYREMADQGHRAFAENGLEACPGILALLDKLAEIRSIVLGLQTGNIRETARLKLSAAGIDPSIFRVGAFGSDSINRINLLPKAWQDAKENLNLTFSGSNTLVIGDTPADIQAAKYNNSKSLAVATGGFTLEELSSSKPDFLFEDLADTNLVLRKLTDVHS